MLKNDKQREIIQRLQAKQAARRGPEELNLDEITGHHSNEWNLRNGALQGKHSHRLQPLRSPDGSSLQPGDLSQSLMLPPIT